MGDSSIAYTNPMTAMCLSFLRERTGSVMWRSLLAFMLVGCARYGVWYVHAQHVAYAASMGQTPDDLWREAAHHCGSGGVYDYTVDVMYPLSAYFAHTTTARNALVQFVAALELILLATNIWLFIVYDVWMLLQTSIAFVTSLAINSAAWTPIMCDAVYLPVGAAWLSDALAGGVAQLPMGGLSSSTLFVALGLYNIYAQRRAMETALGGVLLLFLYVGYHLTLRWHSLLDELFAIALATALVHSLNAIRVLYNIEQLQKSIDVKASASYRATPTPSIAVMPPPLVSPPRLSLAAAAEAYAIGEMLSSPNAPRKDPDTPRPGYLETDYMEDVDAMFRRPPLSHDHIVIYGDSHTST
jgi:hypothetical protein